CRAVAQLASRALIFGSANAAFRCRTSRRPSVRCAAKAEHQRLVVVLAAGPRMFPRRGGGGRRLCAAGMHPTQSLQSFRSPAPRTLATPPRRPWGRRLRQSTPEHGAYAPVLSLRTEAPITGPGGAGLATLSA